MQAIFQPWRHWKLPFFRRNRSKKTHQIAVAPLHATTTTTAAGVAGVSAGVDNSKEEDDSSSGVSNSIIEEGVRSGVGIAQLGEERRSAVQRYSSPRSKEVSMVSRFDDYDRHAAGSNSMLSHHSRDIPIGRNELGSNSRDYHPSREHYPPRERFNSLSGDIEAPSLRRASSYSAHGSMSMSSKGPSWIEKPTPNSSFIAKGILSGVATAGLLPILQWSTGKLLRNKEELDIQAVIAKLALSEQQSADRKEKDLRMNHDDTGLLVEAAELAAAKTMTAVARTATTAGGGDGSGIGGVESKSDESGGGGWYSSPMIAGVPGAPMQSPIGSINALHRTTAPTIQTTSSTTHIHESTLPSQMLLQQEQEYSHTAETMLENLTNPSHSVHSTTTSATEQLQLQQTAISGSIEDLEAGITH